MNIQEKAEKPKALLDDLGRGIRNRGYEGHQSLLNTLGVHLTLVGESYLVGETQNGKNVWDIKSISELQIRPDGKVYEKRHPGAPPQEINGKQVIRVWIPDVEWAELPDSPIRPLLDLFEELQTLSDALAAIDRSRIPAGILKVPDRMEFPEADGKDGWTTFIEELVTHLSEPIRNRKSGSSLVPFAVMGEAEVLDKFDLLKLERGTIQTDIQRMELLFRRIEMGLPLPPEVLRGKADLNHWTGWVISEDVWRAIQPIAVLILSALTHSYFRPALIENGMSKEEATDWWIWFDPTDLVMRPDRTQVATDGWDRKLLGDATWRRVAGFTEKDAPTPEEIEARAIRAPGIPGETEVDERSAPSSSPPPPPPGEPGPPKTAIAASAVDPMEHLGRRLGEIDRDLTLRMVVGAEEAFDQALNRIGAKLRTKLSVTERQQLVGVDNVELASALGPTRVAELGINETALLRESLTRFANRAEMWARQAEKSAEALIADATGGLDESVAEIEGHRRHQTFVKEEFLEALVSQGAHLLYAPPKRVPIG